MSREVQAEGWTFNREYHYEFNKDNNNEILIPNNIIQIKLTENAQNSPYHAVRRSGKLYDRQNHTYEWTYSPIECDVIWEFDFIDLPEPVQNYIKARAATIVSGRIVGDDDQYKRLQQQEVQQRALAMEYETSQGQFTMFGHPQDSQNYYQSYQPFHALQR